MFGNKVVFSIKFIHTILFFFLAACLFYVLYCGITKTYDWTLFLAIGFILIEILVLLFNHWRCPLTSLAEKHGADKGTITDMFLPSWVARNIFKGAAALLICELAILGLRYFLKI